LAALDSFLNLEVELVFFFKIQKRKLDRRIAVLRLKRH